jgi:hypothetical protein
MMKTYSMLIYFIGKAEAIGHATGVVRSRAQGLILALDPLADVQGEGALRVPTGAAHFDTVVTVRGEQSWETGRVDFPAINSYLDVETVMPGQFKVQANGYSTGSIAWRVIRGGGLFEGATGIVTGNFVGHPDDTFTDHQLFKLVLPA